MVLEIAQIDIKPAWKRNSRAACRRGPLFKAPRLHGMELQRPIELPHRYRLSCNGQQSRNQTDDSRLGRFRRMAQVVGHFSRSAACRARAAGCEGILRRGGDLNRPSLFPSSSAALLGFSA